MSYDKEFEEFNILQKCANCACFFVEGHVVSEDSYGLCLQKPDDSLEPFMDDIVNGEIPEQCRELFEKYKIQGKHSCENFEACEVEDNDEIADDLHNPMTKEEVLSLIIDNVDWSKQPVEQYKNALKSSCVESQKKAISSLGGLVANNNPAAFDMLFNYLMELVPSKNTDTTNLMVDVLRKLHPYQNRKKLIAPLVETLFNTPSNNQTRGWYTEVFKFLKLCNLEESEEYLMKIRESNLFSYRIKKKIDDILLTERQFL